MGGGGGRCEGTSNHYFVTKYKPYTFSCGSVETRVFELGCELVGQLVVSSDALNRTFGHCFRGYLRWADKTYGRANLLGLASKTLSAVENESKPKYSLPGASRYPSV